MTNLDVVLDAYAAVNRGDSEGALAMLHPDVELHQPEDMPEGELYLGRREFAASVGPYMAAFDEHVFEVVEAEEEQDGLVVLRIRLRGRLQGGDRDITQELWHSWELRDGKAAVCFVRPTRDEALAALRSR